MVRNKQMLESFSLKLKSLSVVGATGSGRSLPWRGSLRLAACFIVAIATTGCMVQNHATGPYSQSMITVGELVGITFTSTTAGTKTTFDVGVVFGLWAPFGSWPVPFPPNPGAWRNAGLSYDNNELTTGATLGPPSASKKTAFWLNGAYFFSESDLLRFRAMSDQMPRDMYIDQSIYRATLKECSLRHGVSEIFNERGRWPNDQLLLNALAGQGVENEKLRKYAACMKYADEKAGNKWPALLRECRGVPADIDKRPWLFFDKESRLNSRVEILDVIDGELTTDQFYGTGYSKARLIGGRHKSSIVYVLNSALAEVSDQDPIFRN